MTHDKSPPPPSFPKSLDDLRSLDRCPYCLSPRTNSLLCATCGFNLDDTDATRLYQSSLQAADALVRRGNLLTAMRARQRATQRQTQREKERNQQPQEAKTSIPPLPPPEPQLPPLPPIATIPAPEPTPIGTKPRRSGIQLTILITGVAFLAVAATVFVTVAFVLFGLWVKAIIAAAITIGVIALASWLRRRNMSATSEGIAALGVILLLLDSWAIYALNLFGLGASPVTLFWGVTLAIIGAGCTVWQRTSSLVTPLVAVATLLVPAILSLMLWAFEFLPAGTVHLQLALAVAGAGSLLAPLLWRRRTATGSALPHTASVGVSFCCGAAATLGALTVPTSGETATNTLLSALAMFIAFGVTLAQAVWIDRGTQLTGLRPIAYVATALSAFTLLSCGALLGKGLLFLLPTEPSITPLPHSGFAFALPLVLALVGLWRRARQHSWCSASMATTGCISALITVVPAAGALALQTFDAVALVRIDNAPVRLSLVIPAITAAAVCVWLSRSASTASKRSTDTDTWTAAAGVLIVIAAMGLPPGAMHGTLSVLLGLGVLAIALARAANSDGWPRAAHTGGSALAMTAGALLHAITDFPGAQLLLLDLAVVAALCLIRFIRPARAGLALVVAMIAVSLVVTVSSVAALAFGSFDDSLLAWVGVAALVLPPIILLTSTFAAGRLALPRNEQFTLSSAGVALASCTALATACIDLTAVITAALITGAAAATMFALVVVLVVALHARGNHEPGVTPYALVPLLFMTPALLAPLIEPSERWCSVLADAMIVAGLLNAVVRWCSGRKRSFLTTDIAATVIALGCVAATSSSLWWTPTPTTSAMAWITLGALIVTLLLPQLAQAAKGRAWSAASPWFAAAALSFLGPSYLDARFPDALTSALISPTVVAITVSAVTVLLHRRTIPQAMALAGALTTLLYAVVAAALLSDRAEFFAFPALAGLGGVTLLAIWLPRHEATGWMRTGAGLLAPVALVVGTFGTTQRLLTDVLAGGAIAEWIIAALFSTLALIIGVAIGTSLLRLTGLSSGKRTLVAVVAALSGAVAVATLVFGQLAATALVGGDNAVVAVLVALLAAGIIVTVLAHRLGIGPKPLRYGAWALAAVAVSLGVRVAFGIVDGTTSTATLLVTLTAALFATAASWSLAARQWVLPVTAWLALVAVPLPFPLEVVSWWPLMAAAVVTITAVTALLLHRNAPSAGLSSALVLCLLPAIAGLTTHDITAIRAGLLVTGIAGITVTSGAAAALAMRINTVTALLLRITSYLLTFGSALLAFNELNADLAVLLLALMPATAVVFGALCLHRTPEASTLAERSSYFALAPLSYLAASATVVVEGSAAHNVLLCWAAAAASLVSYATAHRPAVRDIASISIGFAVATIALGTIAIAQGADPADLLVVHPLALLATVAGVIALRRHQRMRSWVALAAPVGISLAVALGLEKNEPEWWRIALTTALVAAMILLGALARYGAPLILGAVTAAAHLIIAGRLLLPELVVPWWVWLATAGVLLVFVAATYEARLRNARALSQRIRALR